jgi:hypothetical protein
MKHSWRVIDALKKSGKRIPVYTQFEYTMCFLCGLLIGLGMGVAAIVVYIRVALQCI